MVCPITYTATIKKPQDENTMVCPIPYTEIVNCLIACGEQCIPLKVGIRKYWWCPELDDLKQQCIDMTALWSSLGRPRSGNINAERL